MPTLTLNIPHELGQQEAIDRLRMFFTQLREEHQANVTAHEEEWVDNTLNYKLTTALFSTNGTLVVESNEVELRGEMPMTAMLFKGQIEAFLRQHLEKALS